MATKTFDELKQLAIQIRDEKTNKQNTANRVGTAMLEGINKLEQDYYDKTAADKELKKRDDKLIELANNVGLYNVDKHVPLGGGFYTSATARAAVPSDVRKIGLIITYKTDVTTSVTEQFIGSDVSGWTTDTNWKNVGSEGGNKILEWKTDAATTRKKVPVKERKAGMQISYKPTDSDWVNEQYIGTSFTDTEWIKDNNWDRIPNSFNAILINFLNSYSSINPITWIKGKKVKSYATVGSVSPMTIEEGGNFMYAIIDCKKGDTFYFVNAQGGGYYRTYVVLDSSNKVLVDGNITVVEDKDIVISQEDAAKIVINNTISDGLVLYGRKDDVFFNKVNNELDIIKNNLDINMISSIYEGLINNYATVGSKPSLTVKNDAKYKYAIIDCVEGDTFQLMGGYNTGYYRLFAFLNSEGSVISIQSTTNDIYSKYRIILRAPANAAQLICNLYKDGYITKTTNTEYSLSTDLKSLYECTELSENSVTSGYISDKGTKGGESLFNIKAYNLHPIFTGVGKVLVEVENDNAIDGFIDYAVTGLSWSGEDAVIQKGENCKVGKYQKIIDINVNSPAIVLRLAYSKSCKAYLINDKINRDNIFGNEMYQSPMGTGLDYETLSTEYDYSAIMVTGQSLSLGTANSGNVDFEAIEGCYMLGTLTSEGIASVDSPQLTPLKVVGNVNKGRFPITVTLCNSFKKMLNKTSFKDVKLISLPIGIGGVPISEYEPEGSNGKNLISSVFSKLKKAVGEKKVNILGIIWMQGESDITTEVESYYNSLVNVKNWIQDKAVEVFGQKNKPLFFTYQTGAGYPNRQSIAQFNCAKNNEDAILLNPSHIMWAGTGGTHPNINGYRMYGEITAFQFKRIFLDGYKATAVYPKTIRVDKEFVYINCIVPVPPLRINTKTLFPTKVSIENDFYGFILYDKDNSRYIGIKSISIVGGCTIKITTYGDLTGINLSVRFLNTGNGGRGIICDSQEAPTVSKYVANSDIAVGNEDATDIYGNSLVGISYPTYNWLNQFELDVDNNTIPSVLE